MSTRGDAGPTPCKVDQSVIESLIATKERTIESFIVTKERAIELFIATKEHREMQPSKTARLQKYQTLLKVYVFFWRSEAHYQKPRAGRNMRSVLLGDEG
ncbi:hypothetical protein NDU88_011366 [Pleurodeles waltl]|uniref:Uncharacterized protein n=1 Tax=Pleurodeles waltl TaxID=8319 RepID=A0AAV7Q143_PLEWA|nr:hypothetical protein NDU88_011366 [Pleurodeles waltl]